jgi:hypothetical protein
VEELKEILLAELLSIPRESLHEYFQNWKKLGAMYKKWIGVLGRA